MGGGGWGVAHWRVILTSSRKVEERGGEGSSDMSVQSSKMGAITSKQTRLD